MERNATSLPFGSLPAWLLSLVTHVVLVLLLALIVPRPRQPVAGEPEREVGIVLAHPGDRRQPTYADERDVADAAEDRTAASRSAEQPADTAAEIQAALPATADPAATFLPEIALPGAELPAGSANDLLVPRVAVSGTGRKPILPGLDDAAILAEEAARRAGQAALGPTTRVSVFGSAPATGRSFVFVIDRSKSMGGDGLNALAAARNELSRALAHLTPQHRFQIIAYHHQCVYFDVPRLVPATQENRERISDFIDDLAALGGTDHEMALRAALGLEPDAIFLLNDGGDPHLNEIVLKNVHKLAEGRTAIHCVQFGFGPMTQSDNFMTRLAHQNQGSFTYVDMSGARK
jgi:hypothetical protein